MKLHTNSYFLMKNQYRGLIKNLNIAIEEYNQTLGSLTALNFLEGRTAEEVNFFVDKVKVLPKDIEQLSQKMEEMVDNFSRDIINDQIVDGEHILYQENYSGVMDFTDDAFSKYEGWCQSIDYDANLFNVIDDWGMDLAAKILKFIGKVLDIFDSRQMRILTLEINDITRRKLYEIRGRMRNTEELYCSYAEEMDSAIGCLIKYARELCNIVGAGYENFNMEKADFILNELQKQFMEKLDHVQVEDIITIEMIAAFAADKDADSFFNGARIKIFNYISEMLGTEFNGTVSREFIELILFQMFDISGAQISQIITGRDYSELKQDNELMAMIDELAKTEHVDAETGKAVSDTYDTFLKYYKKYGDNWEEKLTGKRDENGKLLLDKRTKEYKNFKQHQDSISDARDILDLGDFAIDMVADMLTDYDKNIEIMEVLKRNYGDYPEIQASLDRIGEKYNKSFEHIIRECIKKASDFGADKAIDWVEDKLGTGVAGAVGLVDKTIGVVGSITGLSAETNAKYELLNNSGQMLAQDAALETALEKFRNCDVNDENYTRYARELEVCFNASKYTYKSMYDKMAVICEGTERSYYSYCARQLEDLTLKNFESYSPPTYEEYLQNPDNL